MEQIINGVDVNGYKDLYNRYRSAADGNIELSNKMAKLKKENEILRKNLEEKCILPDTISDIAHMKEVESLRSQLDFMEKTHKTLLEQLRQKEVECNTYKQALDEIEKYIDKYCNQCRNEYANIDYCTGSDCDYFNILQIIQKVKGE